MDGGPESEHVSQESPSQTEGGAGRSGPQGGHWPDVQEAVGNLLLYVCDFKRDEHPLMEETGGACNIFSQLRQKQKCLLLRPDLKFREKSLSRHLPLL